MDLSSCFSWNYSEIHSRMLKDRSKLLRDILTSYLMKPKSNADYAVKDSEPYKSYFKDSWGHDCTTF